MSFLSGGANGPFMGPSTFQPEETGTIVYDANTNTLQLCDGTSWKILVVAGGAGSSPWVTTGADIYYNTGNVGVGTTTPTSDLHVNMNDAVDQTLLSVGAPYGDITDDNGLHLYSYTDENNYIDSKVGTNGATYFRTGHGIEASHARTWMTVDGATGNVGIGSGPAHRLTVAADASAIGVYATNSGHATAVRGDSAGYYGVEGRTSHASYGGVMGYAADTNIYGILGHANAYGLYAVSTAAGPAVYGANTGANYGVRAYSAGSHALYAQTVAAGSHSVYALATTGSGSLGVYAAQTNTGGDAFLGNNTGSGYYCYIGYRNTYSIICSGPTSGVSDERLKKNIVSLGESDGLSAVMKLRPVYYNWKDPRKSEYREVGFIAQEVAEVLPSLVKEMEQGEETKQAGEPDVIKVLNYERMIAPAIKAIQQLKADNDNLRVLINEQGRQIEQLKSAR